MAAVVNDVPDRLALDLDSAAPTPAPDLARRFRAALKVARNLDTDDQRLALIAAVVWPTDPLLNGEDR